MIYDFSGITAINTPDGAVTKIEKDGVVLWELAQDATVTITGSGTFYFLGTRTNATVTIDGVVYTEATTLILPKGTKISCWVALGSRDPHGIKVNGEYVAIGSTDQDTNYDYVVQGDVVINLEANLIATCISITEL